MSKKVAFDYSKAAPFISANEMELMKKLTLDAKELLVSKTGAGNDFLGWINLPVDYDKEEFARSREDSERFRSSLGCWYRRCLPWCKSSNRILKT